jgi:hypothetical protein
VKVIMFAAFEQDVVRAGTARSSVAQQPSRAAHQSKALHSLGDQLAVELYSVLSALHGDNLKW